VSEWLSQSYPEVSTVMTSGLGFSAMNRPLWLWGDSAQAKFKYDSDSRAISMTFYAYIV